MYTNKAFTLSEVLITLVIIGVIAAITVPIMYANHVERQTVEKVKKAYSTVSQAWAKYQIDYGCTGNVSICFESNDNYTNMNFFNRFIKYFNVVDIIPMNTNLTNNTNLPDKAYNINGTEIANYWIGISRTPNNSSYSNHFILADGMIYKIHIPDSSKKSGFVFFDTNGKKKPNRIGKDQFVIGIGAYNNPKYENVVHPYYNEDDQTLNLGGLCNIRDNHECNADICTKDSCSPTAYVIKNNKLPPINW